MRPIIDFFSTFKKAVENLYGEPYMRGESRRGRGKGRGGSKSQFDLELIDIETKQRFTVETNGYTQVRDKKMEYIKEQQENQDK
ncbi:hypothetical protein HUJ04_002828 [Dendroctonus ponderosae]|nr:hypothetical protein HUJ04_002828 [Dendroctonus ponderosae]